MIIPFSSFLATFFSERDEPGVHYQQCIFLVWRSYTHQVVSELMMHRQWHPTPVLLPGKSHGRRSLVGYSSWGRRVGYDWATNTRRYWRTKEPGVLQRSPAFMGSQRVRHDLATEHQQQIMTSWSPDFGPQLSSLCYWKKKKKDSFFKSNHLSG